MPAPTPVGTPTTFASNTSGNTVTLTRGAVQNGDMQVAFVTTNSSTTPTDFTSPGFTRRGFVFIPNDPAGRVLGMYTRLVTDATTEPASYVFTNSVAATRRSGLLATVRGVDPANPIAGQALGWSASPPNVSTHAFTVDTADPTLMVYVWRAEITSPNATAPVTTPGTQLGLVPSETGTAATRTVLWAGYETISTTAPGTRTLTWSTASASGPSAAAVVFRGISAPPEPIPGFDNVYQMLRTPGATWAHRGGSTTWPEMSEYAYDQAVSRGYGALEFSANRTSDGVWVGVHDASLNRTSQTTGLPDISAMTWAQVQTYQNTLNSSGTPRPYYRLVDFLAKYGDDNVLIIDPKYDVGRVTEFLDLLDANGGPSRIIVKFYGVGTGAVALANAARLRGYQTWGYFYDTDIPGGELARDQGAWSILGMNYDASTEAWATIKSYGKKVVGHIAGSPANYATAIAKGADIVQVADVANVTAVGKPVEPRVVEYDGTNVSQAEIVEWNGTFLLPTIIDEVS